jgi:2-keto-3-deoxy-6-phosphogluconate aldolase
MPSIVFRLTALLLSFALSLPPSAFALRQPEPVQSGTEQALGQSLRAGAEESWKEIVEGVFSETGRYSKADWVDGDAAAVPKNPAAARDLVSHLKKFHGLLQSVLPPWSEEEPSRVLALESNGSLLIVLVSYATRVHPEVTEEVLRLLQESLWSGEDLSLQVSEIQSVLGEKIPLGTIMTFVREFNFLGDRAQDLGGNVAVTPDLESPNRIMLSVDVRRRSAGAVSAGTEEKIVSGERGVPGAGFSSPSNPTRPTRGLKSQSPHNHTKVHIPLGLLRFPTEPNGKSQDNRVHHDSNRERPGPERVVTNKGTQHQPAQSNGPSVRQEPDQGSFLSGGQLDPVQVYQQNPPLANVLTHMGFTINENNIGINNNPGAGAEELLAEKLKKSGGFGFVAGRGPDYSRLGTWKGVAGFAGQVADRGAVPKIDIQPVDELGLEVLEQFRKDRPDGLVGVALYKDSQDKASQVAGVITAAGGHDLIITAPAAVIADVIQEVAKAGAAGNVLVITKVTSLAEAEAAVAAGARGIEVEPVNEAVLQEVRDTAKRLNLLVVGTASGVTEENAERLLALADYVGFSVAPSTLDEKLQWNTAARYAARWVQVNQSDVEIEEESLEALQQRLQKPEVTSSSGVRARVLTGDGETYDAIVLDQFPTELVPELQGGLSALLDLLNAAGPFSWLDGAGGLGAALREGRNLYPNLSPVLIDAVQWRPDQFTDPIRRQLEAQAADRGIDLWAPGQGTFLEAHLNHVDLSPLQGPPAKLFTMMNALGYNKNPLGLLANIYNQLPEGALMLANLYIPTDHAMAEKLVRFYERLFERLKSQRIADLRVTDFRKMNGIDLNHQLETGPFSESGLGIVLRKGPGQLKLAAKPYSEPFQIFTQRMVEYEVAWYGEDPSQVLTYEITAAGMEQGRLIQRGGVRELIRKGLGEAETLFLSADVPAPQAHLRALELTRRVQAEFPSLSKQEELLLLWMISRYSTAVLYDKVYDSQAAGKIDPQKADSNDMAQLHWIVDTLEKKVQHQTNGPLWPSVAARDSDELRFDLGIAFMLRGALTIFNKTARKEDFESAEARLLIEVEDQPIQGYLELNLSSARERLEELRYAAGAEEGREVSEGAFRGALGNGQFPKSAKPIHRPAGQSMDPTFQPPPFSGAKRIASPTQPKTDKAKNAFAAAGNFQNRSPASAPANNILPKSASVLDAIERWPVVKSGFDISANIQLNRHIVNPAAGTEEALDGLFEKAFEKEIYPFNLGREEGVLPSRFTEEGYDLRLTPIFDWAAPVMKPYIAVSLELRKAETLQNAFTPEEYRKMLEYQFRLVHLRSELATDWKSADFYFDREPAGGNQTLLRVGLTLSEEDILRRMRQDPASGVILEGPQDFAVQIRRVPPPVSDLKIRDISDPALLQAQRWVVEAAFKDAMSLLMGLFSSHDDSSQIKTVTAQNQQVNVNFPPPDAAIEVGKVLNQRGMVRNQKIRIERKDSALTLTLIPVTGTAPAAGAEEISAAKVAEAVERFRVERDPAAVVENASYFLERTGVAYAPILALLESRSKELDINGFIFSGVVEKSEDKQRLLDILGSDAKAQALIQTRIFIVEEQVGSDHDERYAKAADAALRLLMGTQIRTVDQMRADWLIQMNNILAAFGYRLPEDSSVREAVWTLLQAA